MSVITLLLILRLNISVAIPWNSWNSWKAKSFLNCSSGNFSFYSSSRGNLHVCDIFNSCFWINIKINKTKKLSIPPTHRNHFKTLLGVDTSDIDTMKDFFRKCVLLVVHVKIHLPFMEKGAGAELNFDGIAVIWHYINTYF